MRSRTEWFGVAALVTAYFSAFYGVTTVTAFNIDTKIPIIKVGPEKSHFGYSVAQHKSLIPGAPQTLLKRYKSWILVGAPKGENLQPGTKKSGALFKCPLTTYTNDCEQVQTDGLKNSNGVYKGSPDGRILPPTEDEIKDDQWMGVTLKSQGEGGNILVCGHRYQHKGIGEQNFQWGYGLCYRLTDGFEYEDNYQPCMGKPVNLEHEQFGYCQAGTSGLILDDEVVLGIPGTYTWRGTVHTRNISDDYLYRDKTQYFGVYTDDVSPVDKYSYLGYSVAAGKFFGDKMSYVAGAPRSRGTGQVIFFSRQKMGNPIMNYDLILNGETFASSFGFEVLAMDTNGDKKDDLVVSAPFYFTRQSSGAVYIYQNDGKGISNETPFIRLEGPPGESRFGYSMTSLGDLNMDGYDDLAVGAPYENRGAIYIYLGSKDGIVKEPSQVIRAEDLPGLPYDAFGYALSGGMDLDDNNYNDLLTSSFCSDRVVLLRARPIVSIQTEVESQSMQNINPAKPGCIDDRHSPETCFSFKTCFKMINDAGALTSLEVRYNISERVYKDQPLNRIRFHRARIENPSTVEQIINLRPENMGKKQCFNEIVYLKSGIRDVLRPVRFKLSYEIHQEDPKPVPEGDDLPDINDYPILNQKEAVRYFEATFSKDCGDDDICESDLTVFGELDLEEATYKDTYIFELGKQQYFTLTVNVTNSGEPAYVPNLYIAHDKAIDLSLRETQTGTYHCVTVRSGLINCDLDNPLINTTGPLHLVFKPSGLPFKTRNIELFIWANSTSEELNYDDNRLKFILDVRRRAEISITGSAEPEQVFYSGDVVGESAIETLDEIGTEVIHKYLIDNRGPWKVDEMQVRIDWPYQVENNKKHGKWLLYLTDIPIVDGDGECDVNPQYVNPLTLGASQVSAESEFETGTSDRLKGVIATPPSVTETTKITETKKVNVTSVTKKTYRKTSTKTSSSSVSASETEEEGDQEGLSGGSEHGSRQQTRVSRKIYKSGSSQHHRPSTKDSSYDYNTDDYENYDQFFSRHKPDQDVSRNAIRGKDDDKEKRISTKESTYIRRVYTTDSDGKQSSVTVGSEGLNAVEDIRTIKDGEETYINGYDAEGNLVWSSRTRYESSAEPGMGGVQTHTEHSRQVYSTRDGGLSHTEESDNERLLSERLHSIVDFRIVKEGDESFVNGYSKDGIVVWTSRGSKRTTGDRRRIDMTGEGDQRGGTSYKTEYSYRETTRNGEGEGAWSSSVTDDQGTRTKSGSSKISKSDSGTGRDRSEGYDYGEIDPYSRRAGSSVSHSASGRNIHKSRSFSEEDGHSRGPIYDTTERSKSFVRSESGRSYSSSRSSSGASGEGYRSRYHGESEGSADFDASVTDEHNYETDRSYGYNKERSGGEGDRQYHFDWNDPKTNQAGTYRYSKTERRYKSGSDSDGIPEGRWSATGGFRRNETYSSDRSHQSDSGNEGTGNGKYHYSSDYSSNHNRNRSSGHPEHQSETEFHGNTYSRAVLNDDSGNMNVFTQKVFTRKSANDWEDIVHGPYRNEEWSDTSDWDGALKRTKREREYIIKPEAITDAQTGKMMQIVSIKCDSDVPTAKCFTFTCTIRNLPKDRSVTIRIPSRLWNATLVEDYPRVSYVSIKSRGELILPEEIKLDQDQSDDVSYAETLAYSNLLEQLPPEEVPVWVIVVSVLAGLLLLVLIAVILYKLGFFKRKRPDPTLSGNIDRDINGYN